MIYKDNLVPFGKLGYNDQLRIFVPLKAFKITFPKSNERL